MSKTEIIRQLSLLLVIFTIGTSCSQNQQDQPSDNFSSKNELTRLLEGNKRFLTHHPIHPDENQNLF